MRYPFMFYQEVNQPGVDVTGYLQGLPGSHPEFQWRWVMKFKPDNEPVPV